MLSKLLCSSSQALSGSGWTLAAAAAATTQHLAKTVAGAAAQTRGYASAGGSGYTVIDHEYDAVVVGAGGALWCEREHSALACQLSRPVIASTVPPASNLFFCCVLLLQVLD